MSKNQIILVVIGVAGVIGILFMLPNEAGSTKLDGFAQCLGEKGLTFYGAFWCPHCQKQKAMFENSAKFLPYVECSTPDGKGQTQVCIDKGIQSYPTWTFPDGTEENGQVSLSVLAEKSGCVLPSDTDGGVGVESGASSASVATTTSSTTEQ